MRNSIPMPSAEEISEGAMHNNSSNTCCLVGWARVSCGANPYSRPRTRFYEELLTALANAANRSTGGGVLILEEVLICFNDRVSTPAEREAVWRAAATKLGFTEVYKARKRKQ